jgi:predicted outer membrane protein
MSVFKKICTGLLLSSMSVAVQAAQTEPQSPVQDPGEPSADLSSATEVIQLLHVGVSAEMKIIDLVRERNPDEAMQQFIELLAEDASQLKACLQELASSKSVSLSPEQLTEHVQMIESQMAEQVQVLADKSREEFRAAVIEALVSKYTKALELYTQVEQSSTDEDLKRAIAQLRPITQKHLDGIQQLKEPATEAAEPAE